MWRRSCLSRHISRFPPPTTITPAAVLSISNPPNTRHPERSAAKPKDYCLNVASHLPGEAGGVLIRALDPIDGLETMADLRGLPHNANPKLLTGGPGRLCQALDMTRKNSNGLDVTSRISRSRT